MPKGDFSANSDGIWFFFQKHVGAIDFQYFCCSIKFIFNKRDGLYSWGFGFKLQYVRDIVQTVGTNLVGKVWVLLFFKCYLLSKVHILIWNCFQTFHAISRRLKVDSIGETVRMYMGGPPYERPFFPSFPALKMGSILKHRPIWIIRQVPCV